jgi:3-isopropylmalate/(R)-2-methylmalate dehydratase small subunit
MRAPFIALEGLVVPLDRANVNTDAILPKQFMKSISRSGFGDNLFDEWRYLDYGEPGVDCSRRPLNGEFNLNQQRYKGASILLARENFGCGSSREHAVWALLNFGIRALIAPSFADIFYGNCIKNGILPITLPGKAIDNLFKAATPSPGYRLNISLSAQTVTLLNAESVRFEIDGFHKVRLKEGLDDIDLTLRHSNAINQYEVRRREVEPWIFSSPGSQLK